MARKRRMRRTVVVTLVFIAVGSVVLTSIDAEEESKAGATTVTALMIGLYIRGQWQRGKEEDAAEAGQTAPAGRANGT